MTKQEYINWVAEIKESLPLFMDAMQGRQKKGFYRYSFSGDYFGEKRNWGLGNSVFALKIFHSIGQIPRNLAEISDFIQSFQNKDGSFYDQAIRLLSFPYRTYFAIKELDINRLNYRFTISAETRQAISALKLFDLESKYQFTDFPRNQAEIEKFLNNLNWKVPWGAAAHFSALLFFLSVSKMPGNLELINYSINYIQKYRQKDGCWYSGNTSLQQKINGAMKVITGMKAAASLAGFNNGELAFDKINELIDTLLMASNDAHACDNFNLIYVLRYANQLAGSGYRYDELEKLVEQRLNIYKQYYFPEHGAFSFYKQRANTNYYGAIISKGRNEPDIHGTVMFIWGLAVIGNFWGTNEQTGLREFVT